MRSRGIGRTAASAERAANVVGVKAMVLIWILLLVDSHRIRPRPGGRMRSCVPNVSSIERMFKSFREIRGNPVNHGDSSRDTLERMFAGTRRSGYSFDRRDAFDHQPPTSPPAPAPGRRHRAPREIK